MELSTFINRVIAFVPFVFCGFLISCEAENHDNSVDSIPKTESKVQNKKYSPSHYQLVNTTPDSYKPPLQFGNLSSWNLDSSDSYGAGDCWGEIISYSHLDSNALIDTMICSEYGFSERYVLLINNTIVCSYFKESNSLMDIKGENVTFVLSESIFFMDKLKIHLKRTDTVNSPNFSLIITDFDTVKIIDLKETYEQLEKDIASIWEMEEEN